MSILPILVQPPPILPLLINFYVQDIFRVVIPKRKYPTTRNIIVTFYLLLDPIFLIDRQYQMVKKLQVKPFVFCCASWKRITNTIFDLIESTLKIIFATVHILPHARRAMGKMTCIVKAFANLQRIFIALLH